MRGKFTGSKEDGGKGLTDAGSALIVTVLILTVLCLIAGTLLSRTASKQSGPFQAASWHEAGSAAEAGVEIALNALRRSISEGSSAWDGWTTSSSSSPTPTPTATASPSATPTATPFAKKYITESELLSHEGEGNNTVRAIVEINIPTGTGSLNPPSIATNQYAYLVRSTGLAEVPVAARRLSQNKADLALRKLNLFRDFRSGNSVGDKPQVSRVIEAIVVPVAPFPAAIASREMIEIKSGSGMIVDSYDPKQNPYKYDASKPLNDNTNVGAHRSNGNIVTNAKKKNNEDVIRLENVKVYGLAAKGSGKVNVHSNASISGQVIDGFYREMKPVQSPRNNAGYTPIQSSPALSALDRPAKATYNIVAGEPGGTPKYYKFSKIHLHDAEIMKIKKATSGLSGGIAEVWVTGDVVIHKGGRIEVEDGANVVFYFEKNLTLEEKDASKPALLNNATYSTGAGFVDPGAAQFYGVVPNKDKKHVKIKTNMAGLIYAPDHEFEVKLKSGRHIYGALSGRKFEVTGNTQIHYDENMSALGRPYDYTLESWQEDWFDPNVRTLTAGP